MRAQASRCPSVGVCGKRDNMSLVTVCSTLGVATVLFCNGGGSGGRGRLLLDRTEVAHVGNLGLHRVGAGGVERRDGHGGGQAEKDQDASEPPRGFLDEVGRLTSSENLCRSGKVGSQSAAFRVLYQYDQCEKHADDENQDDDKCVHCSLTVWLFIVYSVLQFFDTGCKNTIFFGIGSQKFAINVGGLVVFALFFQYNGQCLRC